MEPTSIDRLIEKLQQKDHYPFPSGDCRKLIPDEGHRRNFVTALDLYFTDIAGYASWGIRIAKWSNNDIEKAGTRLQKSFFEQYPEFCELESLVTETNTPELSRVLGAYESIRELLLKILSVVSSQ